MKLSFKAKRLSIPSDTALFHITHWRAGSQWMLAVLKDVFGREVVAEPEENVRHLLGDLGPAKVYPCAYVTKGEFDALSLPQDTRRAVLVRDLRDALVSTYFSSRNTHVLMGPIEKRRWFLQRFNEEQGLLYMMDFALHHSAQIQRSWLEAGERVLRLEDFMVNSGAAFVRLFREHWRMDVPEETLEEVMSKHSFARYSGGRAPGQEDRTSHYRKGVHGDWRQHFTPKVVDEFKRRYAN